MANVFKQHFSHTGLQRIIYLGNQYFWRIRTNILDLYIDILFVRGSDFITPTEKKNETKTYLLLIYFITMFQVIY
jgi:hypothetical protein